MQITNLRPVGCGGRRIAKFNAVLECVQLNKLTLIRNAEGEIRVFGDDITRLLDSIAKAALAQAEAGHE